MSLLSIRRGTPEDAASLSAIWQAIVAEREYSAVDRAFTPDEERDYIGSLSAREGLFAAEVDSQVIGFQSLDLSVNYLASMRHVGQLGTFVLRAWRGQGIGHRLADQTFAFARANDYEKLVIFVRAKNTGAQAFYRSLGFVPCGRFTRQVRIAGEYDDEILMEVFL
jgi:ribosomal protein S18 acetylase RimI-like enzyme